MLEQKSTIHDSRSTVHGPRVPVRQFLPAELAQVELPAKAAKSSQGDGERLAAMDALRGGAMLLGIFIHAAISYMPTSLDQLFWGIREQQTSVILNGLFWWVHACRLPLFFVIAGFFAVLVAQSKGIAGFLRHRLKRLFVPYAIGVLVILPIGYLYGWCCGLLMNRVHDDSFLIFELDPMTQREILGPMHLWFLQDLMILSAIFIAIRLIVKRGPWTVDRPRPSNGSRSTVHGSRFTVHGPRSTVHGPRFSVLASLLLPFVLAVPTMLILWYDARPLTAHRNSFIPDAERLLYNGLFFLAGALLYSRRQSLPSVFAWPVTHLALSLVAGSLMLWLLGDFLAGALSPWGRLAFAASAASLAWLSVFGFTGLALRCFRGRHPLANYLADASYWVYLVHLPIVCLIQLSLFQRAIDPLLKCGLVMILTAIVSLGTYHTMVRCTFVGRWLHGPRRT